jgi:two-component system sensor histidine kinase KdpD
MSEVNSSGALPYRSWRLFEMIRHPSEKAPPSDAPYSAQVRHLLAAATRHSAALAIVALIVLFYRHVVVANETTVGFTFLLAILCASTVWSLSVAIFMSIASTFAYDYFFLPPVGAFNISDYRDWVALVSFFVTAAIGAYLSAWARREAKTANDRRRETEQLYDFSRRLWDTADPIELLDAIPGHVAGVFGTGPVALSFADRSDFYHAGLDLTRIDSDIQRPLDVREDLYAKAERSVQVVPLRTRDQEFGALHISEPGLSQTVLEAVSAVIVVGIERARAIERAAKMEAARETEQLKSVFLDAIAHDFKTPLTSIKGSATALLAELDFGTEQRKELLVLIDEECDRINKLIGSASEMARLDAGQIKLDLAPHSIGDFISASMEACQGVLRERRIDLEVKDRECLILVDLPFAKKVLVHLIDNANLYSSPGKPIAVRAERQDGRVMFSVADSGPGIEETELGHIFEKFYRGKGQRDRVEGTGMGLAIASAIVRAHGGAIEAMSDPGKGSIFTFFFPLSTVH